jgi:nitrous oxidase accessory protein
MKKTLQGLLVVAAAACAVSARAAQHMVSPGQSIAAAIRAAQPGDVVRVERGLYLERLVVDKPLTLAGAGRPTLSAQGRGDVIRVRAADVVIEGFIVRDSGADLGEQNAGIYVEPGADRVVVRRNDLAHNLFGIWLNGVKDAQLVDNLITGKRELASAQRGNGIQLFNTTGAQVVGNNISFARDGIYVDVSHRAVFRANRMHHLRYGTHYMNSDHNVWEGNHSYLNRGGLALMQVRNQVVRGNHAWGNTDHGIMLRSIQDSVIEDNVVSANQRGLFVYDAEYNVLNGNLVIGNRVGVHLAAGSIHNQVEGNDFIGNHEQMRYVASRDEEWGRRLGNYWSNYAGWDVGGDGVGDVPYEANDMVDRLTWQYPLVKLLLNSPAVHALRLIGRQFPLLRSPSVVDRHPQMRPFRDDWKQWLEEQRH